MSTLAKLSKQAVQLEHDRQYEKALALFTRLFDEAAGAEEEVDVALFNRAGDVAMRLGDATVAVRYYERAIDAYAAGGLLNNAIAVCNKMLRQAPDHAATHYTLGVLHAKQGFRGDAKHHFVEYADQMHRAGRDDEAVRAIAEFAALCPVGDDAHASLAQHLSKGNRGAEVAGRLQAMLDGTMVRAGGEATVAAVAAASSTSPAIAGLDAGAGALVFLDVSMDGSEVAEAPLAGFETTALSDATTELRVEPATAVTTTAAEPALDLEAWGDLPFTSEPALLDLDGPAFDLADLAADDFGTSDVDLGLETVAATPSSRYLGSLPGELPMLSLAGWIGSASAVGVMEPVESPAGAAFATALMDDQRLDLTFDSEPFDAGVPFTLDVDSDGGFDGGSDVGSDVDTDFEIDDEPAIDIPLLLDDAPDFAVDEMIDDVPVIAPTPTPIASLESPDFVDLGAWLRESEPAPSTRMTTDATEPTGDEAADFAQMLGVFRAGVARNVEAEDYASHYDLGVAFREMGLIDDAVAEFQKAARSPSGGLRAREALGQCFLDRGSPELAAATLQRAIDDHGGAGHASAADASLLGVLYLLGLAHAQLGASTSARACLERVVAADIQFRDAAARLSQLSALST